MTVEAWVREVEKRTIWDPEAMCGKACCTRGQYRSFGENYPGGVGGHS